LYLFLHNQTRMQNRRYRSRVAAAAPAPNLLVPHVAFLSSDPYLSHPWRRLHYQPPPPLLGHLSRAPPPPQVGGLSLGARALDRIRPPESGGRAADSSSPPRRHSWRGVAGWYQNHNPCYSTSYTANHKLL